METNEAVKRVTIDKSLGRYNLYSNDKEWSLSLRYGDLYISERFDEDEEPDTDGVMPSDILWEIKEKKSKYLYSSSAQKDNEIIQKLEEVSKEMDIQFINQKIKYHTSEVNDYQKLLEELV